MSAFLIGVHRLYYGNRAVGEHPGDSVNATENGVAAEDMSPAVLTAEDGPLGEYGKTVKRRGVNGTGDGVCVDLIVECHVDAVMVAIESHRFHIDVGIKKLGAVDPCTGGGVQHFLGAMG